jgi:hypothetical protein
MTRALARGNKSFVKTSCCKEGLSLMTPRERAVAALSLQVPDFVPTFELEFQLEEEMFGKPFLREKDLEGRARRKRKECFGRMPNTWWRCILLWNTPLFPSTI